MDCPQVQERLGAYAAGRLEAAEREDVARHLDSCATCREAAAVEADLTAALQRLPRHRAPEALKRRLQAMVPPTPPMVAASPTVGRARRRALGPAWAAPFVSACAAAMLVLVAVRTTTPRPSASGADEMVSEAVNDHLRVVSSSHPVEIESGGIHQVKPWFTGRLEFAPRVGFSGDAEFPLVGGSIGYFRDRKAAVFVFKRRLHTITLLVFPPDGLDWPTDRRVQLGPLSVAEESSRGFSALFWRDGGLGYALVSDVNSRDLEMLAARLYGG
jgi:anti-sigma factor RsiW